MIQRQAGMTRRLDGKAFTLIELLVVIAIISLLASVLLPSLKQAKALAARTNCLIQLKNLALAENLYANENGSWFPHKVYPIESYPDYYSDHKRHVIRENAAIPERWVNAGWLVRDEFLSVDALFCPSGWSLYPERWVTLGDNKYATLYSHFSLSPLYYKEGGQFKVAPRLGFAQEGDSYIPLAADCNTRLDGSGYDGVSIPWYSVNVAMWHQDAYNVVYLDGRATTIQYHDDMFTGQAWYLNSNCTNWSFFNYVKGK